MTEGIHPLLEVPGIEVYAKVKDPDTGRIFLGAVKAQVVPGCGTLHMTILTSFDLRDLDDAIREWAYRFQRGVPGFHTGSLIWVNGLLRNQGTTVHSTYEEAEEALKSGLEAMSSGWQSRTHEWVKRPQVKITQDEEV